MDHDTAMRLATTEYARLGALFARLDDRQWAQPTDCTGWDVRAIAGHLVGMLELAGNREEQQRQDKAAHEAMVDTGGYRIDALTALQVAEHAHLATAEVTARFSAAVPGALAGRFGLPPEARQMPYEAGPPFNEQWTLGYLLEIIMTRDPWMHRVDIARATGLPFELTPDHDGVLIADVVEEWARRHGTPFHLSLKGTAGGTFSHGTGGPRIELDAIDFCRILSGRAPGEGLLAQEVPF
jgi:uncharacterized protein (TIGR03083 family)